VTLREYPAGHMMYVHAPTRVHLAADLREFIQAPSVDRAK
jgi:carboxypeptidase C (cathepsin A)